MMQKLLKGHFQTVNLKKKFSIIINSSLGPPSPSLLASWQSYEQHAFNLMQKPLEGCGLRDS